MDFFDYLVNSFADSYSVLDEIFSLTIYTQDKCQQQFIIHAVSLLMAHPVVNAGHRRYDPMYLLDQMFSRIGHRTIIVFFIE